MDNRKNSQTLLRAFLIIAVTYVFMGLYRYFNYWGIGIGIILLIILFIVIVATTSVAYEKYIRGLARRTLRFLKKRIIHTTGWQLGAKTLKKNHPRLYEFIRKRFTSGPYGSYLTAGVFISCIFIILFGSIAQDLIFHDPLIVADARITYLTRAMVTSHLTYFFLIASTLGGTYIIILVVMTFTFYLAAKNQIRAAYYFLISLTSGLFFSYTLKYLFHRPRPYHANLIAIPISASFPSAHAVLAVCVYGFIGLLIASTIRKRFLRACVFIVTILGIFCIGLSRIYLGVHYASDVIAGWYLGLAIISFVMTLYGLRHRTSIITTALPSERKPLPKIYTVFFICAWCGIMIMALSLAVKTPRYHQESVSIPIPSIDTFIAEGNKYSETLVGVPMSPMSFIVIGSRDQLISVFEHAGWYIADAPTPRNFMRLSSSIANNAAYDTAPMTPAFYNTQPNDLGFEKPTAKKSARQRHHTRYWRSGYTINDNDIWVATASYDKSVGVAALGIFPTHTIDPLIDNEREFIYRDLVSTGLVARATSTQLVAPTKGHNAAGDVFETDGKAYILYLSR